MPYQALKCFSMAVSSGVNFPESLGVICCNIWIIREGNELVSHHLIAYLPNFNIFLQLIDMVILSKVYKPNNFGTHKSWQLSFTYIWGLWSNFVDYESFLELNYFNILASCDTTWKTQLNLAISLWGVIFLKFQSTLLHICMVLQVKWMSKLLLHII